MPIATGAVVLWRVWLDHAGFDPQARGLFGSAFFWSVLLPPFLLGTAVLKFRAALPRSSVSLLVAIVVVLVIAQLPVKLAWRHAALHLLVPPLLVYGLFYLAFHPRVRLGNAARYGDVSYGCYLYAFPLQQIIRIQATGRIGFAAYVLLGIAGSLVMGLASWWCVERWFESSRKPLRRPRRPLARESEIVAP